jgi:hypothetical protein
MLRRRGQLVLEQASYCKIPNCPSAASKDLRAHPDEKGSDGEWATFDRATLQAQIAGDQRVGAFALDAWQDGAWW